MSDDLKQLLAKAQERFDAMTPAEQEAMFKAQREGYARAEASWPKPNYQWVDGVKVYASYENYCND
jgi:hypothetical protein